jgi:hypothetical protein
MWQYGPGARGGGRRGLSALVLWCRLPSRTDPGSPRFRPVQTVGTGGPLWNSLWCGAPGLAPAGASSHQRPPSQHPRLLALWDRSRGERGPDRPPAASVRVRGPGLGPVGLEVGCECAADRGGGGPGPPPAMPQIGRSIEKSVDPPRKKVCPALALIHQKRIGARMVAYLRW